MKLTYGKDKKLKSKKATQLLFTTGASLRKGPLRVVYIISPTAGDHQIGVSAGKRFFKKAVDRNRVKRLMRESYRLQQELLPAAPNHHIKAMFIYQSAKMPDFDYTKSLTKKLLVEMAKNSPS
jgi:ribonuclease P protein component